MEKKVFGLLIIFNILFLTIQVQAINEYQSPLQEVPTEIKGVQIATESTLSASSIATNLTDDDAVMGNPNAPVTIVEFGGLEEPFSELFWNNTFPTIKSQYIDTGKVKFVFRDFPLVELFPFDGYAAVVAECAHQQGGDVAYFQMWNALYATNEPFSEELIDQTASNLGYDINGCVEDDAIDEVVLDLVDAIQLGIEGAPSFFINDEFIDGAQPTSVFLNSIERALNESVVCFTNSQCNDSNPYTFDRCVNPGQLNAICTHQAIQCLKNSDCGNTSTTKFCSNNNLCNKTTTYACANPGTPQSSCSSSVGEICGICLFGCNNQSLVCKPSPIITIYSPFSKIYNITSIQFNLTTGNDSFNEISFIDWNETRPRWTALCKNCNEYGFKKKVMKSFDDGVHNLTFKAINNNVSIVKNVSFFIDSKDPGISSILPKSKGFTNGSNFYIKYTEANCKSLALMIYGNISSSGGGTPCTSGANVKRYVSTNLNSYNNKEIEYQFVIKDIANNSAESKRTKVKVDTTKPLINSFTNSTNGRRVTFTLNITELNFDEVNYIDYNDTRPIARTLCSSLRNGICISTKTFRVGNHNLTITVLDEAGNSVQKNSRFTII
ncbi:MAG: thioredoxin domain-containing protein [Nanoarchaeota archaeon]